MDMKKIGTFLAQLRKENGLTQEQLGEKLGVTNKTVSRWETGTYLPPVEMMKEMGALYGVSINEIVSGERLEGDAYREKAEENIGQALSASAFTLKDRIDFFKRKWRRDNLSRLILSGVFWAALLLILKWKGVGMPAVGCIGGVLAVLLYLLFYNQMMAYVEKKAYESPSGKES